MDKRRRFLTSSAAAAGALTLLGRTPSLLAAASGSTAELGFAELPDGTLEEQLLYALPGKLPLIKKTFRPPNFETPIQYFRNPYTQNKAFFVRWHLAGIPIVDAAKWRLKIGGESANREVAFNLNQLRTDFVPAQVTAVCQCSGNRRGLFEPHVAGVQWGVGAMGNAVWRGVRLKDLLAKAGVKSDAVEVAFNGADGPAIDKTPDFVKSLPIDVAMDEGTLVAFEMNNEPLPHWNGGPARLVVPGWTGTYWVKQLTDVRVLAQPEKNFWMATAYRLPKGKFNTPSFKSQVGAANEPITTMVVNSLVTSLRDGQKVKHGQPLAVSGIAWDGGSGIAQVEVSADGGASWQASKLGKDLGRYSFRTFSLSFPHGDPGARVVMARATAKSGETQVSELIHNPAGYHHNVIQKINVEVV
jgi:DMSO/TMAO reductase YedYZ molybdopterin-dependent catalytic subunit